MIVLSGLLSQSLYCQSYCDYLGEFNVSIELAYHFLQEESEKNYKVDSVVSGMFTVVSMCKIDGVNVIEFKSINDSIGYRYVDFSDEYQFQVPTSYLVLSLDEPSESDSPFLLGNSYSLTLYPYFRVDRIPGDFYYPIVVGSLIKKAIEVQITPQGNYYYSPNVCGRFYVK